MCLTPQSMTDPALSAIICDMNNESKPVTEATLATGIPQLTLSGESETVEFKQSTGEMREITILAAESQRAWAVG